MKIYTKKGDQGMSSLISGRPVSKHDDRLDAYGDVDELNSHLGLLSAHIARENLQPEHLAILTRIQNRLFNLGGQLACDEPAKAKSLPNISIADITDLETAIDQMEKGLSPLTNFILPTGSPNAALAHIARTICRRAERHVVRLHTHTKIEPIFIAYLNRLSDFLFVLARDLNRLENINDVKWEK